MHKKCNLAGQKNMRNNIKFVTLSAIALAMLTFMNDAQAVNQNMSDKIDEKKAAIEDKKVEKICERIENVVGRLENRIGGDGNQVRERVQSRIQEMEENRINMDAELESRRANRDQNREEFYNELTLKAGDDADKKLAVEKFKTTVEEAIKVRREAIDQARKNMNTGIDSAIDSRESSVEALRNEFKNNVEVAVSKAKNSCNDDASSEELKNVLSQLKEDIKSYKESYKAKISENKKVQSEIQSLREIRKVAVSSAIDNFKATMKNAQEELRQTMGSDDIN